MSSGRFRRYQVGERIGGDLSVVGTVSETPGRHPVYIVWDHRAWCPAACKTFRTSQDARREADVLNQVAHPNIVRALGTYDPAILLLEFLEGPDLETFASEQPAGWMSTSDAIRAAIYIGSALAHVHAKGWIHLDVKPVNVILANGRPVLFDFGTVRRIGAPPRSVHVGTDAYMSPEACALEVVSPASDVFALGVTLYEMLTGDLPFPGGSRADPYPQLALPPRPVRSLRPGVSAALDRLVLSCLARAPEKRPGLAVLLPALHDQLRGGPRVWPEDVAPAAPRPSTRRSRQAA